MTPMIPNQIFTQRKSDYVGVDNLKVGLFFKVKLNKSLTSEELEEVFNPILGRIYTETEEKLRASLNEERGIEMKSHKISHGVKIKYKRLSADEINLACYLNNLNGNVLLRRFLTVMHFDQEQRKPIFDLKSTTLQRDDRNFIPIFLRTHLSCKRNLAHYLRKIQNELLFREMEDFKELVIRTFTPHIDNILFETYVLTCIEICFDDIVPAGINYVTHPELGMRLARNIALGKRGKYFGIGAKCQQTVLPPSISEGFVLKDLYGDTIIPGVDSLYGRFKDKTELYVASKEIPDISVSAKKHLRFTRNFQQIRYEWRLRHNPRFKRSELAERLSEYTEDHKTFQDFTSFNIAINLLKSKFQKFLNDALNVKSQLTSPPKLSWAYFLAAKYQLHIEGLNALFTYPYRLNSHAYCANVDRLEQGLQMGIFEKRPGYYDQDFGIRWDYFENPKKFKTKSVFYPDRGKRQ